MSHPLRHAFCLQTPYGKSGFFLVEFGDGSRCVYVKEEQEKSRFPLQFGRYDDANCKLCVCRGP